MAIVDIQAIKDAEDITREIIAVPEWGGEVIVATMSGNDRDSLEQSIRRKNGTQDMSDFRARVVVRSLVDENGAKLFTEKDVPWLTQKSAIVLDRIFDVACRVSGLRETDIKDLAKNSQSDQSEDSG